MEKKLVSLIFLFFTISALLIAGINDWRWKMTGSEDDWTLYFSDPTNESSDFSIKNSGPHGIFHWEILSDNNPIFNGEDLISTGETKNFQPDIPLSLDAKKTIRVYRQEKKKEIYKHPKI